MSHQGQNNIRNGIAWVQTGHSTCTRTGSLHVIDTRTVELSVNCNAVSSGWARARCSQTTRSRTRESVAVQEHTTLGLRRGIRAPARPGASESKQPQEGRAGDGHRFENWRRATDTTVAASQVVFEIS